MLAGTVIFGKLDLALISKFLFFTQIGSIVDMFIKNVLFFTNMKKFICSKVKRFKIDESFNKEKLS